MRIKLFFLLLFITNVVLAQNVLQPGFDAVEYTTMMAVSGLKGGKDSAEIFNLRKEYKRTYQSPVAGLSNRWSFYVNDKKKTAIISIRGTVGNDTSWAANYYFAMIPAQGVLEFSDKKFEYKLAENKEAAVHTGWTIALASMADDVVSKIKESYQIGIKDFYVFGHSQGGAIAYLLRSYLHYRQQDGTLPKDILFKTYCSAPPKPGNMQYVYDYDFITRGGWACSVVNAKDWVCESPFTLQTMDNMNAHNPLINVKSSFKDIGIVKRAALTHIFNKMERKPAKTQQMYIRYFGKGFYKMSISKMLPGFKEPVYSNSINYMRAGSPVILMPDKEYLTIFNENDPKHSKNYFLHHSYEAYYYLLKKDYLKW